MQTYISKFLVFLTLFLVGASVGPSKKTLVKNFESDIKKSIAQMEY